MNKIVKMYKNGFLKRYDKDGIVPYLSYEDFDGLNKNEESFLNSSNTEIHYYFYYRDGYKKNELILFLPGIGPGHTAYMREIDLITSYGYKVLTLDYAGCDKSKGESLYSLNAPTKDVIELLDKLDLKMKINVIGHSLGGYTALNILKRKEYIDKGIIISGFLDVVHEMMTFVPFKFLTKPIIKYEKKIEPDYFDLNQIEFLKKTSKKILFIASTDDKIVSYNKNMKVVESLNNSNLSFVKVNGKGHNPNYTKEALDYMNETFSGLKKLKTKEEMIEYMSNKDVFKMTEQDKTIFELFYEHLNK